MKYLKLFEQVDDWEDPFGEDFTPDTTNMNEDIIKIFKKEFPEEERKNRRLYDVTRFIGRMVDRYNSTFYDIYDIIKQLL